MTLKQAIVQFTPPRVIHLGKWIADSDYRHKSRHLSRLKKLLRYQVATTEILGKPIEIADSKSFLWMYDEIFEREIYSFRARVEAPYIIDCGANIGLSVLYFKRLYPQSRVVAFEPDQKIFDILNRNIQNSGYGSVDLHRCAVWTSETNLSFMREGADGGRLAGPGDSNDVLVPTVRLRDYLSQPVDFLKLDIEGAEVDVLADCANELQNVDTLFVEYLSFAERPQRIDELTTILTEAGYRLHIHPPVTSPQPFMRREVLGGMDMQLNVFAFRQ